MDVLALSMKSVTFLGILAAAAGMNLPHVRVRTFAAAGLAGLLLMVVNAWLAVSPLALALDAAYLAGCVALLWRSTRATVAFEVVPEPAA